MKLSLFLALSVVVSSASGAILTFNSLTPSANAATGAAFISAIGETQDFVVNFNSLADGSNIHGVLLSSRLRLFDTNATGGNVVEVECTPGGIGGSNPIGACAAEHDERAYLRLAFETPVDYVSFFDIDSGSTTGFIDFVGGGSVAFALDTAQSAEFFGVFRNNMPQIVAVRLDASGDGRWGLDNVAFGISIPEPSTIGLFSAAALLFGVFRARTRRF